MMDDIKERFKRLQEKRKLASHQNFKDVLEENERLKRPANWERTSERVLERLKKEEDRQKAEELGEDYDQKRMLEIQANEAEKWDRTRNNNKKKPDPALIDYEAATKRQHDRLVKQLKPDLKEYERVKKTVGEDLFYLKSKATDGSLKSPSRSASSSNPSPLIAPVHLLKQSIKIDPKCLTLDSKEGVDRMVEDVEKQIDIRSKRSRRRKFDHEADVDYINERNMRFNKKLERFYNEYTAETKQNLERGTAL